MRHCQELLVDALLAGQCRLPCKTGIMIAPVPQVCRLCKCYLDKVAEAPSWPCAYLQQPLQPAACLNVAAMTEEVIEGLIGPHNGRSKHMQGFPSELCGMPSLSHSRRRMHP